MRASAVIVSAFAVIFTGSAFAEDGENAASLRLEAPTIAETDRAEPDWFQAFTSDSLSKGFDIWQAGPDQDVSFSWIKGDRWQLNIDLTSRGDESPLPKEEVSAEATFRLTPRISIGGSVSIGADELNRDSLWQDEDVETGVRLKSAFKF